MPISNRCIRGLMPNLIKKSWTVSTISDTLKDKQRNDNPTFWVTKLKSPQPSMLYFTYMIMDDQTLIVMNCAVNIDCVPMDQKCHCSCREVLYSLFRGIP